MKDVIGDFEREHTKEEIDAFKARQRERELRVLVDDIALCIEAGGIAENRERARRGDVCYVLPVTIPALLEHLRGLRVGLQTAQRDATIASIAHKLTTSLTR